MRPPVEMRITIGATNERSVIVNVAGTMLGGFHVTMTRPEEQAAHTAESLGEWIKSQAIAAIYDARVLR